MLSMIVITNAMLIKFLICVVFAAIGSLFVWVIIMAFIEVIRNGLGPSRRAFTAGPLPPPAYKLRPKRNIHPFGSPPPDRHKCSKCGHEEKTLQASL